MSEARCRQVGRIGIILAACLMLGLSGCSILTKTDTGSTSANIAQQSNEDAALYYDFDDVMVPKELKVLKDTTVIIQNPGLTTGILALKGRMERQALTDFFEHNMAKDNWQPISFIKSLHTILLYKKPGRSCVINITEKGFYTYVEIWVAPTIEEGESGLLK